MQDYKLTSIRATDFKDNHNNVWCDVSFDGVSEPVKWVVKDPSKLVIGESYYGTLEEKTSKAGKIYMKFKKIQKEEYVPNRSGDSTDWDERQRLIMAQWSIQTAVKHFDDKQLEVPATDVEKLASSLYDMAVRVATRKK